MTDKVREALEAAKIGLANAQSFRGKPLGDVEQRSVERGLEAVRAALAALDAPAEGEALSAQEAESAG